MARPGHTVTDADLVAYADGEAGGVSRPEIEAFLAEHPAEAARVETWRRQGEVIRAAFARVAFEPLPAALTVMQPKPVRAEASALPPSEPPDAPIRRVVRLPRRRSARRARVAIAAIALAGGGVLALYVAVLVSGRLGLPEILTPGPYPYRAEPAQPVSDQTLRLARRAGEAHRAYASADAIHAGELTPATDPTLAAWLSRRTGVPIRPPDFSAEGLKLLGGRITPGGLGPAAYLLYENAAGERVGLFVARLVGDEISGPIYREDRGAAMLTWTQPGVGRALTASGCGG
jgi:anti-sigma factor RsiW